MIRWFNTEHKYTLAAGIMLPLSVFIVPKLIALFAFLFIVAHFPFKIARFTPSKLIIPGFLILFYLINFLGLFQSSDLPEAWNKLETKFAIFAFGIFFLFNSNKSDTGIQGIKYGLVLGGFISVLISVFRALLLYSSDPKIIQSNNFGWALHPSFLALLLILSALCIWTIKSENKYHLYVKLAYTILVLFELIMLRSLGSYVCLILIILCLPLFLSIEKKNWKILLYIPVGILAFLGIRTGLKALSGDMSHSVDLAQEWLSDPDEFVVKNRNNIESSTVRLVAWTLSYHMIQEKPQGYGIGDSQDELNNTYRANGYTFYAYRNLNPHNQYLDTGIQIGFLGLFLLLFSLFLLLILELKNPDAFIICIGLCIFTSLFFESFLERQVGVMTLIFYLLLSQARKAKKSL